MQQLFLAGNATTVPGATLAYQYPSAAVGVTQCSRLAHRLKRSTILVR